MSEEKFMKKIKPFKRTSYVPVTETREGALTDSKFGGIAWVSESAPWPGCPHCKQKMNLFVQLNLETLPERPVGCPKTGLIQLFYCTNGEDECDCELESWAAFSKGSVVRLIQLHGTPTEYELSPCPDTFEESVVVGWNPRDDYPNCSESIDLEYSDEELDLLADENKIGDKLFGWPHWVQSEEYPECTTCSKPMDLVLQIDSEYNLPYMFGDMGVGHITQCSKHPEVLAFAWACF